jgi:transcriptional antiterminator Rof (Rho-off)
MSDYRPVDCDTHSRYEEAIVLRRQLRLKWRTPEGTVREEVVRPVDVLTHQGEEFLVVHTAAKEELRVRLDHITQAETV